MHYYQFKIHYLGVQSLSKFRALLKELRAPNFCWFPVIEVFRFYLLVYASLHQFWRFTMTISFPACVSTSNRPDLSTKLVFGAAKSAFCSKMGFGTRKTLNVTKKRKLALSLSSSSFPLFCLPPSFVVAAAQPGGIRTLRNLRFTVWPCHLTQFACHKCSTKMRVTGSHIRGCIIIVSHPKTCILTIRPRKMGRKKDLRVGCRFFWRERFSILDQLFWNAEKISHELRKRMKIQGFLH